MPHGEETWVCATRLTFAEVEWLDMVADGTGRSAYLRWLVVRAKAEWERDPLEDPPQTSDVSVVSAVSAE